MKIIISGQTDSGIEKQKNYDSFYVSSAETPAGPVAFGIVCDGLDGLQDGDVASSSVTRTFKEWYHNRLPILLQKTFDAEKLMKDWNQVVQNQNKLIQAYSRKNSLVMGTSLTAILVCQKNYYVIHVGDTRAYRIGRKAVRMTNDHTMSAEEVRKGTITEEQEKTDRRRNILLQSVGVSSIIKPEFCYGTVAENTVFLLCSNSFFRQANEKGLWHYFEPEKMKTKKEMESALWRTTFMIKMQKEKDSITGVLIKVEV